MSQQRAASPDCHERDRRNAQTTDVAMTAPLKTVEGSNIAALMREIGEQARSSARVLALAPTAQKDRALAAMAAAIRARQDRKKHTSELQSLRHLVCRLLLEKKK